MPTQEVQQMQGLDSLIEAISERVADKVCQRMGETTQAKEDKMMTRQQVMDYLHITDATLWRWGQLGLLVPSGKVGSRVYYKQSDVEKALKESMK